MFLKNPDQRIFKLFKFSGQSCMNKFCVFRCFCLPNKVLVDISIFGLVFLSALVSSENRKTMELRKICHFL